MVTIFDVAKKAGVSVVTVSRLLNNPQIVSSNTAKKIFRVIEQLNYQPSQIARSMVSKRTNTIGVIMPDIKNTFFNSWFRFIEEYTTDQQFNILLCNTDEDPAKEMKYVKLLQAQRVDGVIIVPHSKKSVEYLSGSGMPFILFDRMYNDLKTNFVTSDHYQGTYDASEYLVKMGHKKIAVLRGPGVLYPDIERYAGFADVMKKYKIEIDPDLVLNCEFNEDKAAEAAISLLKRKNRPTAIFPFNGAMTKGVIKSVQKLNLKIPKDISLVSFDQIPGHDIFQPKITHVFQPIENLGRDVIVALIKLIKKNSSMAKTKVFLKPRLVIGESVKNLKK